MNKQLVYSAVQACGIQYTCHTVMQEFLIYEYHFKVRMQRVREVGSGVILFLFWGRISCTIYHGLPHLTWTHGWML